MAVRWSRRASLECLRTKAELKANAISRIMTSLAARRVNRQQQQPNRDRAYSSCCPRVPLEDTGLALGGNEFRAEAVQPYAIVRKTSENLK